MPFSGDDYQPLYDKDHNLLGVFLSAQLWDSVKDQVLSLLPEANAEPCAPEPPEPLADWESLARYWDFSYPLTADVACVHCGSTTDNWQNDNPRKFRLKAANLGGLVNFECLSCRSRILKRHFKSHVDVECRPFLEKTKSGS